MTREDAISRQAAIDFCNQIIARDTDETADITKAFSAMLFYLMNLPSVKPMPCKDAISRSDALKCLEMYGDKKTLDEVYERLISLDDGQWVSMKKIEEIKAEINEERECAYADFERYKVEYLGQDWEDVFDSLPQDEYRYGMERCLEIISKHIGKEQE